tara:strand:+ start:177 stop:395 length:219 start_codon:yes stop_codon:yes gene_type:complete
LRIDFCSDKGSNHIQKDKQIKIKNGADDLNQRHSDFVELLSLIFFRKRIPETKQKTTIIGTIIKFSDCIKGA